MTISFTGFWTKLYKAFKRLVFILCILDGFRWTFKMFTTIDKLPIISQSNIYNNLFIGSGAGRQGILLGPGMGKILSDLITSETSEINIKDNKLVAKIYRFIKDKRK